MLSELRIRDFAIIEELDLTIGSGLVIFTGETGAGKSIIIDAVSALLGSRADPMSIRAGADRALIEGVFRLSPDTGAPVIALLKEEDLIDDDSGYLVLGREIQRESRNVARVNGRSVNVGLLRTLGEYLVDIHGQTEHLSLLRVREHLKLLDRYADSEKLLADYRQSYSRLVGVRRELASLRQAEREAARRTDLLAYQIDEMEKANLKPGEEEDLKAEQTRLANAETLVTQAQGALTGLEEGSPESPSAADLIGEVYAQISGLARTDPSQESLLAQVQVILDSIAELTRDVQGYLEGIEFNPARLAEVERRLDLIYNLKRKYGDTVENVLEFLEAARAELETISHASERILELESEEGELLAETARRAEELSGRRKEAASELARGVEVELISLRMEQAEFRVDFQVRQDENGLPLKDSSTVAFDSTGFDQVEFLVAPNPGEGLKPLIKIASGGETSRLMLALKNVLAQADHTPTLIFDEIDQGIGGRVGFTVGEKLELLGRDHQVMCITHLPQLAAFGAQHFQVTKALQEGRTVTQVEELDGNDRLNELALMMGAIGEGTRQSAREILESAREASGKSRAG
jgi:DNA repair protein RecN (Recombination protein N)